MIGRCSGKEQARGGSSPRRGGQVFTRSRARHCRRGAPSRDFVRDRGACAGACCAQKTQSSRARCAMRCSTPRPSAGPDPHSDCFPAGGAACARAPGRLGSCPCSLRWLFPHLRSPAVQERNHARLQRLVQDEREHQSDEDRQPERDGLEGGRKLGRRGLGCEALFTRIGGSWGRLVDCLIGALRSATEDPALPRWQSVLMAGTTLRAGGGSAPLASTRSWVS